MERWAIWVDIECFSKTYPTEFARAIRPLRELMLAIHRIGSTACREAPHRLFAHQCGDGFIIVSDLPVRAPEMPLAIAIHLLRRVLMAGGTAKAGISEGDSSDIKGCYREELRWSAEGCTVPMGEGLLHLFPVMGTALINAHTVAENETGSLVIIDDEVLTTLPEGLLVTQPHATKRSVTYSVIDWVNSEFDALHEIEQATGWHSPPASSLSSALRSYVGRQKDLSPQWREATLNLSGARHKGISASCRPHRKPVQR